MKRLTRFSVLILISFALFSCSEEPVQIDDGILLSEESALKTVTPEPEPLPDCSKETAWSFGDRYVEKGNWATFTKTPDGDSFVPLYAGQIMPAGEVRFYPHGDQIKIKIYLKDCVSLQKVDEPIKIQGYDEAPTKKPVPGHFYYKNYETGNGYYYVIVDRQAFFGVHVDVEYCCD